MFLHAEGIYDCAAVLYSLRASVTHTPFGGSDSCSRAV